MGSLGHFKRKKKELSFISKQESKHNIPLLYIDFVHFFFLWGNLYTIWNKMIWIAWSKVITFDILFVFFKFKWWKYIWLLLVIIYISNSVFPFELDGTKNRKEHIYDFNIFYIWSKAFSVLLNDQNEFVRNTLTIILGHCNPSWIHVVNAGRLMNAS